MRAATRRHGAVASRPSSAAGASWRCASTIGATAASRDRRRDASIIGRAARTGRVPGARRSRDRAGRARRAMAGRAGPVVRFRVGRAPIRRRGQARRSSIQGRPVAAGRSAAPVSTGRTVRPAGAAGGPIRQRRWKARRMAARRPHPRCGRRGHYPMATAMAGVGAGPRDRARRATRPGRAGHDRCNRQRRQRLPPRRRHRPRHAPAGLGRTGPRAAGSDRPRR